MRILILGGTEFVGRALVDEALTRDWQVTVLNRGTREAPAGVSALRGDRSTSGGLAALEHGEWDFVVDTWSWAPAAVRDAATLLADRADRYVYVSSRSVYAYPAAAGATEDAPVVEGSADDEHAEDYARAKAGSELAAVSAFGDRALLLRAGLILGPHENIGRLPWWLQRIARGGMVLAPGPADAGIQYIDARDLAAWALTAAESGLGGAFNAVSQPGHATMRALLESCVRATGSGAHLQWRKSAELLAAGVTPWSDLPIWLPPGEDYDAMHRGDASKAAAAGLRCRPVDETVADTWAWLQSIGGAAPRRPDRPELGLDPALEERVLSA